MYHLLSFLLLLSSSLLPPSESSSPLSIQYSTPAENAPQKRKEPEDESNCWFCLANPNVETHLITSIATETYLALAKGPILPTQHVLIIPIQVNQEHPVN